MGVLALGVAEHVFEWFAHDGEYEGEEYRRFWGEGAGSQERSEEVRAWLEGGVGVA